MPSQRGARRVTRASLVAIATGAALVFPRPALSQPDQAVHADNDKLARAKELFRHGVTMYEAGDVAHAADYFRRSRMEYPSSRNTINEALCLQQLGRFDEALELYERAITESSKELSGRDREDILAAMRELRPKLGEIDVASNVAGSLVIGSRPRGRLPLAGPVRVLPGRHVVRVLHQGHATYETTVTIRAGQRALVDAKLEPLAFAGGIRVEDEVAPNAVVTIDGAEVGSAPWEGMLAPGAHVVQSHSEDRVSVPVRVTVLRGQTVLARLRAQPVASSVTIQVEPSTAEILLNDVTLGHGSWTGQLPVGEHRIRMREEGYRTEDRVLSLATRNAPARRVDTRLSINPDHPRWPRPPASRVWMGPWVGGAIAPSMRSGPEARCPYACSSDPPALGWMAGLRVGYETPASVSFEVALGYLSLHRAIERTEVDAYPAGAPRNEATYALEDRLRVGGPFVAGGVSHVQALGGLGLRTRLQVGALFTSSRDVVTGSASGGGETVAARVVGTQDAVASTSWFVMPEVGLEADWGGWELGAGLGVLFVPAEGPTLSHEVVVVDRATCGVGSQDSVACAPEFDGIEGERAYGPFWAVVPRLTAAYAF